jgi:hypothetical protein
MGRKFGTRRLSRPAALSLLSREDIMKRSRRRTPGAATVSLPGGTAASVPGGEDSRLAGAEHIESWAGEVRVNLVRLAALVGFYGYHLLNGYLSTGDPAFSATFHLAATALAMVWTAGVAVLYLALSRRWAPPALKYAVTVWDLVLLTTLVALAGDPRSPLVVLYFLVIVAAALRMSLPLVYVATLGSIAAYAFLLAHHAWYVVGSVRYYANPGLQIPRTQEAIFVLALGGAGVLTGQVVRQARRLVLGYPVVEGTEGSR